MYLYPVAPRAGVASDLTSSLSRTQGINRRGSTWENPGLPHGKVTAVARRLVVFLMLAACGGGKSTPPVKPPQPPVAADRLPIGAPLVTPGEHMTYKLSLVGAELATFELQVGGQETAAGKPAIVVQTHAKVSGLGELAASAAGIHVDDTFTSWIDVATGRPLRWYCDEYATSSTDKERTEAKLAERSGGMVPIEFHINDEPAKPEPQKVSLADTWDYNSFLVALRSWEAPAGSTVAAEVLRSRFLWHVDMKIGAKSQLHTALGDFPALELHGHAYRLSRDDTKAAGHDERDFTIWISDDSGRVPLKVVAKTDYGDVEMQIVEYNPGR
jgi:hypothetical protein